MACFYSTYQLQRLARLSAILFLVLFHFVCFGQNETDNWYFGKNAGTNFSNVEYTVLSDGAMEAPAGCASISDKDSNLMLYSNGATIWNRNHEVMTNGSGLLTDLDQVQTVLIIPNPVNEDLYYVLHNRLTATGAPDFTYAGLYLTIVDFSTDALGVVTEKNIRIRDMPVSRMTSTFDYESNTFKIITLSRESIDADSLINRFTVFTVTDEGVQLDAQTQVLEGYDFPSRGQMTISPDNTCIAIAEREERWVYLLKLDLPSATFTFSKQFNPDEAFGEYPPYGVAFSQDSRQLYFTASGLIKKTDIDPPPDVFPEIYKISAGDMPQSLQLARNGKIYVAFDRKAEIGIFNYPERSEDKFEYVPNSSVSPGISNEGLPNIPAALLRNRIVNIEGCLNQPEVFEIDAFRSVPSALWDFGDGTTSTQISPTHTFTSPGLHKIKVTIPGRNDYPVTLYRDFYVFPPPMLDNTTVMKQCDPDNNGSETFNLENILEKIDDQSYDYTFSFYHSEADALSITDSIHNPRSYINISNPERIYIRMTSEWGCVSVSSFLLEAEYNQLPALPVYAVCEDSDGNRGDSQGLFDLDLKASEIITFLGLPSTSIITYYPTFMDALTKTEALSGQILSPTVEIWVRVDDQNYDCNGIGTLNLFVSPIVTSTVGGNYLICGTEPVILEGSAANSGWEWKDDTGTIIGTTRQITITEPGTYSIIESQTHHGVTCSSPQRFVTVGSSGEVAFVDINAANGEIVVSVTGSSTYQFSIDNLNFYGNGLNHTFSNLQPGMYTIYVRDFNGCELPIQAEILLINFDLYFTPNGDGLNETWNVKNASDYFIDFRIEIFNRYGTLLFIITDETGWDGTFKGKNLPATDYWFNATLTDPQGRTLSKKGHFSLKR